MDPRRRFSDLLNDVLSSLREVILAVKHHITVLYGYKLEVCG